MPVGITQGIRLKHGLSIPRAEAGIISSSNLAAADADDSRDLREAARKGANIRHRASRSEAATQWETRCNGLLRVIFGSRAS
jgi:hypothetical protein